MSANCDSCFGRLMSGSSPIMTTYRNDSNGPANIGITPKFTAKIVPLSLTVVPEGTRNSRSSWPNGGAL